jgi:hypothetical protein
MAQVWDPATSPAEVAAAIVGEVTIETDDGPLRVYVEGDTLGRGLVFLNFDGSTAEDYANVEADFAAKGYSDRVGFFLPVPFDSILARQLAELLVEAADNADAGRL